MYLSPKQIEKMAKGECNHCGQALDFDESMSGSEIPCPSCGTTIKLLIAEEVPPKIELASVTTSRSVSSNLISCRDCGKDVSPSASACPNCGCPISSSSSLSDLRSTRFDFRGRIGSDRMSPRSGGGSSRFRPRGGLR